VCIGSLLDGSVILTKALEVEVELEWWLKRGPLDKQAPPRVGFFTSCYIYREERCGITCFAVMGRPLR